MSIKKTVNESNQTVSFDFDGEHSLQCGLEALSTEMITRLALHGLSQKVGDSYSANQGTADAFGKASEVYAGLQAGNWNTGKSGGGGDLVEAIMKETGKDRDTVSGAIAAMTKEDRKALRARPQTAAILAAIKAQRMAERAKVDMGDAGVDLQSLFA
jgi:hypothetical protein